MKITTTTFTKTLQVDAYTWLKVGLEANLEENDTPENAIKSLESTVDNYFKEVIKPKEVQIQDKKEPEQKLTKEEKQKKCITDTKTIDGADGLLSFALLVKNNPHLQETYDNHFKKLHNESNTVG